MVFLYDCFVLALSSFLKNIKQEKGKRRRAIMRIYESKEQIPSLRDSYTSFII